MSLALLQNAVSYAGDYVGKVADHFTSTRVEFSSNRDDVPAALANDDTTPASRLTELPAELLLQIFSFLDGETLASTIPLVCKAWKAELQKPEAWHERVSSGLLAQVDALATLGGRISTHHLYLAMKGRNFLRNPAFRRDSNTQLLELGRSTWNKWTRDAWVIGHTSEHSVDWELRPAGFSDPYCCGADAPPPPLPYGGGGMRLGERVQQQLRQLLGGLGSSQGTEQAAARVESGPVPPSCVTTTADWCEVMQLVDLDWELQRRGLTAAQSAHLLDSELSLRFSVYVGSRSDTLGQFCVCLILDECGAGSPAPQMQGFVMRPTRHNYFSGRVRCEGTDRWQRFEYTVAKCPRGFRRAFVLLRGRRAATPDSPDPLPVFCGAKFACAELAFL